MNLRLLNLDNLEERGQHHQFQTKYNLFGMKIIVSARYFPKISNSKFVDSLLSNGEIKVNIHLKINKKICACRKDDSKYLKKEKVKKIKIE